MSPRRPALAASAPLVVLGLGLALGACSIAGLSSIAPSVASSAEPSPTAAGTATPTPAPSPSAGIGACAPSTLTATILAWDAGAGHRTATVRLTSTGSVDCTIPIAARPQLVGGDGAILIDGSPPDATGTLTLHPGDVVQTAVQDGNYCGPPPIAPVSVAFVFLWSGVLVGLVARPVSPTDVDGLPPCLGPGSGGDIEMQPWAP